PNCRPARAPPPTIDRPRRAPGDAGAGQPPDATHTCAPGWWPPVVVANGCHRSPTAGDPVLAGGFARTAAVAHSGPTCHRSRHHTYVYATSERLHGKSRMRRMLPPVISASSAAG